MLKTSQCGVFFIPKYIVFIIKVKLFINFVYNLRMLKVRVPFAHASSIYQIDVSFFKKLGVKYVLTDLDNTLDSYKTKLPTEKAKELKKLFESNGLELVIISNNTGKRVSTYATALGVRYLSSVGKPFAKKLLRKLSENKIDIDLSIMVGDQVVTDITCANRAGIKSVLTDKLVKEDQPTTRINRLLDRPLRRALKRKHLLKDWREF